MKPIFEKVPHIRTESFYCELVTASTPPAPWHFHPESQITLVLHGHGHRMVGDNLSRFGPGDLVFVGPNLPHVWHYEERSPKPGQTSNAIVIQFRENFCGAEFLSLPESAPLRRLFRRGTVALQVDGRTRQIVEEKIQMLSAAQGLRRVVLLLDILECLAGGLDLRPISSPGFHPDLNPFDQDRVSRVCLYVNEHLHEAIFREDLARLLNLSPDAFGRYFKSRTGKTLPAFVNELRISRACRMLAETDFSVIQIALECGFENLSNFNRQFRRHTERTPREYRSTASKQS